MRWLAAGGTCGQTVTLGDGGWRRAHASGRVCGAFGARVCRASVVLNGWCVGVMGVPCSCVMGLVLMVGRSGLQGEPYTAQAGEL